MKTIALCSVSAFSALLLAAPANAASTFPYSCSNSSFQYSASGQATLQSTCLMANGMPHQTSLVLMGISNQNGKLTQGSGDSTFQKSCGSIQIEANSPDVTLSAYCRSSSGQSIETSLPLNNISNNNGNLQQK